MTPTEALDRLRLFVQSAPLDVAEQLQPILDALQPPDPSEHVDVDLPSDKPQPEIMNTEQVMALLQYKSRESIRLAIKRGMPSHQEGNGNGGRGNKRTFRRSEILDWLQKENAV